MGETEDIFWLKEAPGKTLVVGAAYIALVGPQGRGGLGGWTACAHGSRGHFPILFFLENQQNQRGNSLLFLKRTMVEKNGESSLRKVGVFVRPAGGGCWFLCRFVCACGVWAAIYFDR